jgi:hypothetical protein
MGLGGGLAGAGDDAAAVVATEDEELAPKGGLDKFRKGVA